MANTIPLPILGKLSKAPAVRPRGAAEEAVLGQGHGGHQAAAQENLVGTWRGATGATGEHLGGFTVSTAGNIR